LREWVGGGEKADGEEDAEDAAISWLRLSLHTNAQKMHEYAGRDWQSAHLHGLLLGFTRVDLGLLLGLGFKHSAGFLGLLGLDRTF